MHYNPLRDTLSEYQGKSFTRTLYRGDGEEFAATTTGYAKLIDESDGSEVANVSLTLSGDKKNVSFNIPKATTAELTGKHKLLVNATRSDDSTFDKNIAEYKITYKEET